MLRTQVANSAQFLSLQMATSSLSSKPQFHSSIFPKIQSYDVILPESAAVNRKNSGQNGFRGVGVVRSCSKVVAIDDRKVEGVGEKKREKGMVLKVGLIYGGPSAERGISLNSARSVLDHIQGHDLHVSCYYIDSNLNAYAISSAQTFGADVDEDGNVDGCRLCGMDGALVCCDGCPLAYHSRCIGIMKMFMPEGAWYCPECIIKKTGPIVTNVTSLRGAECRDLFKT